VFRLNTDPQSHKSLLPIAAMIDFKPLCPPALPRSRNRNRAKRQARSSLITIQRPGRILDLMLRIRQETASPLRFMNVCGFTSRARSPSMVRGATNERHSVRFTVASDVRR
jgi:hypothetical protein